MGGTSQEAQRKAWNEAMMSSTGDRHHPVASSAAASALLASASSSSKRRSDRHKKTSRREKARKSTVESSTDYDVEAQEYRLAVRMDALEGVADGSGNVGGEDEEEYDELEEAFEAAGVAHGPKSKKRKTGASGSAAAAKKKKKKTPSSSSGGKGDLMIPGDLSSKRFRPRSLASILMEEAGSQIDGGNTHHYLNAEARTQQIKYPSRKFCPVTGLYGIYKDSKTGINYANLQALEQIRERVPFWMN